MADIMGALKSTVPISLFNKGLAGRIFDDVKKTGAKVVMRNNTPECVLISPEEYIRLNDEYNDAKLLSLVAERIDGYDPDDVIPAEEVYRELGITDEAIEAAEVEFE